MVDVVVVVVVDVVVVVVLVVVVVPTITVCPVTMSLIRILLYQSPEAWFGLGTIGVAAITAHSSCLKRTV